MHLEIWKCLETHFFHLSDADAQSWLQVLGHAQGLHWSNEEKRQALRKLFDLWIFPNNFSADPQAPAEAHSLAMEKNPLRYKASDVIDGGRRSFSNTNGFLALGPSKKIHKTRPGHGNQIFKGPWYNGLLFQDGNNSEQNDEWDFPCTGHNTYVCSRKKSWSKKTWMSAAKEKPVCASDSGEIVQGVHLESPITPTAWPRSVSFWGVPTLQSLKYQM